MAIRTIDAADIVYMLSIGGVVSVPTRLQGAAVDDFFSQSAVDHKELQLGVDGYVGAGWIPALIPQKIMLLASSPSIDLFELWAQIEAQAQSSIVAQATVYIPGTGKNYTCVNGYLSGYSPMPAAKKVLAPREFTITWQNILPAFL